MASGSIKKNAKTGLYDIVVDTGKAMSGKRQQKRVRGFRTRGDAQIEVTRILAEVNGNVFMKPDKTLLGSYMTLWLDTKRSSMTRLTCDSYESYIKNYITPIIGNIPLNELTHDHLDTLVADLRGRKTRQGTPFVDSTIQRIFNIIVTALNDAVRTGLVMRNVAKMATRPKVKRKTVDVWTADEAQRFLVEAKRSRHYPAYLLALATGMRQGEILGLAWRNVDFDNGIIHVVQTLSHDGKELVDGAKSLSGIRAISVDANTLAELRLVRETQNAERDKAGPSYVDHGLIVTTAIGKPVFADTIIRMFKRFSDHAGVRRIRFHDLRHTHATLLLKANINPKVVSERLGHASVTITLDTYSHLLPSMQREAAFSIGQALFTV